MAVSIIAWIERCPSSWEARNITKSHQTTNLKQQTSHNTFIGRGKQNPRGWLPLSGEKLQQTVQDTQLIWSFLGRGWNFSRWSFSRQRLVGFHVHRLGFSSCRMRAESHSQGSQSVLWDGTWQSQKSLTEEPGHLCGSRDLNSSLFSLLLIIMSQERWQCYTQTPFSWIRTSRSCG